MHILAVETACPPGSVALLQGEQILIEVKLGESQRTMQTLFPEIQNLLMAASWQPRDVQLVAISIGPGSFTGLRIGVALAKTWAFATGAAVKAVSTLDVLAGQADTDRDELWVSLDAQRRQLFAARYLRGGSLQWQRAGQIEIVDRDQWLAHLPDDCAVSGAGLAPMAVQLEAFRQAGRGIEILPPECWNPRATTIGRLALQRQTAEGDDDFLSLSPYYCRRSAAEEKLAEKAARRFSGTRGN